MASVIKRKWTSNGVAKEAWVVRFVDRVGARRSKTFEKKKDADRFRVQVEAEIVERGFGIHIEDLTVDKVVSEFLANEGLRVEDGRIGRGRYKAIELACRTNIRPFFGKMKMAEVSAFDVERWYGHMRAETGLQADTARGRVMVMKQVCEFARRRQYCRANPVVEASAQLKGIKPPRVRTFTREEIAVLLRTAEVRYPKQQWRSFHLLRVMVHLAAFCGLRWGEIMALTEAAIDFEAGIIHVRQSLTHWNEVKCPKTRAGVRDVPMPKHLGQMLRDWIDRYSYREERGLIFTVGTPDQPTMLHSSTFHNAHWRKLLIRAGLHSDSDPLHFHALRHFAASWWIMNGLPLPDTASLLGHSRVDVTLQVYAHAMVGGSRRTEVLQGMSTALLALPAAAL
jgi:integrase